MTSVGYVYDELMLLHEGWDQLENPDRIVAVYNELYNRQYLQKMNKIESKFITKEELALAHDPKYISEIYRIFSLPEKQIRLELSKMNSMFGNKNSIISAEVAAGSTLNLMKAILNGWVRHGVAIVRSPGHHANASTASGFCFFNNVAISAKHAINCGKKIAVVDWDIHEGDGTLDILKHCTNSLFITIQRYDHGHYYPGTGKSRNTENVLSIPINKTAYDNDYYNIFDNVVLPRLNEFNPDVILVSAGFDAGEGDPLGGFHVTPDGFYNLTKKLLQFKKPIILVLEGGYNLDTISQSMAECTRGLLEDCKLI
ncbi:histone deacetylase [Fadolivirus algeromassiliense]|uniref:histone deacetylase n=1 Tax=Fadolivirus FV1/VV64 TaxID=3070911 RepID=A0A7D3UQX6_9VIRU|nr:histone deacetylase [Fadolivirus algeromassiliense]QKF94173.1 histone deacetylase [Fadolivirus FV1/VV64]